MNQVFPLLTGYLGWAQPPSLDPVMHPVYAYLIVTAGGASILVDSGNPRSLSPAKSTAMVRCPAQHGRRGRPYSPPGRYRQNHFRYRSARRTHFDFDHSGNTDLFDDSGIQCFCKPRFSTMRWRGTARAGALEQTGCAIRVRHRRLRARARNYAP